MMWSYMVQYSCNLACGRCQIFQHILDRLLISMSDFRGIFVIIVNFVFQFSYNLQHWDELLKMFWVSCLCLRYFGLAWSVRYVDKNLLPPMLYNWSLTMCVCIVSYFVDHILCANHFVSYFLHLLYQIIILFIFDFITNMIYVLIL